MNRLLRFSPARLALAYFRLTVLVLALFAILLWYAWRVNLSPLRAYVPGEVVQRFVDVFERDGADGLAAAMDPQLPLVRGDVVMVFPVISVGGGETTRVVVSHVRLRGGYHLLVGRESVRFESLVASF